MLQTLVGKGSKGEECTVQVQIIVVGKTLMEVVEVVVRVADVLRAVEDLLLLQSSLEC